MDEYWRLGFAAYRFGVSDEKQQVVLKFGSLHCRYGAVYEGVSPLSPGTKLGGVFELDPVIYRFSLKEAFVVLQWLGSTAAQEYLSLRGAMQHL